MPPRSSPSRAARCSAPRCRPTSAASSKPTGMSGATTSASCRDHRPWQRPRRSRLRNHGGRKDHGAADQFHWQPGFRQTAARRRDQDLRDQHSELPYRRRRLRSRPHRAGSRAAAAVLSQQGLCRCQRVLSQGRIRSGAEGVYADLRDRRRPALPLRRYRRHLQCARTRCRETPSSSLLDPRRRRVRRQRARQEHARYSRSRCRSSAIPSRRPAPHHPQCRRRSHRHRLCDRSGTANLCRAHRNPRQYPHPRLRDPPRVRYCRRRCLQQDPDRSRRAAAEELELLQDRENIEPARAPRPIASCSTSRPSTSRPATSTSPAVTRPPMARWSRSR